ncbi:MAG: hypothetical protein D8M58_22250 [Calditrichaeota bacterium]|nr:MAG: hypothetical protein DWQ03_08515 [Calditrichota bacterium]MBL1208136.1 hypothetical protein [Calditrichota bacterium]NOG47974.1 hypothetical protein [Calditrichota bacterium]
MIDIVEDSNEQPICPHCEKAVTRLLSKQIKSRFGIRYIYFCEHCKKVLSISQRKGFWMG